MTADACGGIREFLPELALGIATGEERALALEHVAHCSICSKMLAELSEVADDVLLVGPERQPPVGFEMRVLERLQSAGRRGRPRVVWLAVAAALAVGIVSAAGVLLATRSEREVAARYQETLAVANGEYFSARELVADSGHPAGHVFGYQGKPSWAFVVIEDPGRWGIYDVMCETSDGRRRRLGSMEVRYGSGSWGTALPVDLHDIVYVEVRKGDEELAARF